MKTALMLLFPATSLLYYPLFVEEFEQPKAFVLIGFSCFAAFIVNWRSGLRDRVAQALLAFTISAAISTAVSIDWHMSLFGNPRCPGGLLVIASFLVAYVAFIQFLNRSSEIKDAVRLILFCSALVAIYAIAQVAGIDFKQWVGTTESHGYIRPMSSFGHPNFMAGYLAMTLPFAAWRFDKTCVRTERALCAFVWLISIVAIFLSQSRGMWLASIVGMSVYLKMSNAPLKKLFRFFAVAIFLAASLASISPSLRASAAERVRHMLWPDNARLEYWKGAIKIWDKHPFFGIGTDTFEIGFQNRRTEHYWQIERAGSPHRAHNDIMNTLATQGIFGIVAALAVALMAMRRIWRPGSWFWAPSAASICAFYVEGLSSFTTIGPALLFVFCLAAIKQGEA